MYEIGLFCEFLGGNFVSSLRTLKHKKNLKHLKTSCKIPGSSPEMDTCSPVDLDRKIATRDNPRHFPPACTNFGNPIKNGGPKFLSRVKHGT